MEKVKNFLKKRKKVLIIGLLVIIGLIFAFIFLRPDTDDDRLYIDASETSTIERGTFQEVITENGKVVSKHSASVYPELESKVTGINYQLGDQVKQGDLLLTLDNTAIYDEYQEARKALEDSLDARKLQVETAQVQLDRALSLGEAPEKNAQKSIKSAYDSWSNRLKEYKNYLKANPNDTGSQSMKNHQAALATAEKEYQNRLETMDISKMIDQQGIQDLQLALRQALMDNSASKDTNLSKLASDIEKAYVYAPISGTITEINVRTGEVPSSYLLKIETTEDLEVNSSLSEFDINKLGLGSQVEITSNALGLDKKYTGNVNQISPTTGSGAGLAEGEGLDAPSSEQEEATYKTVITFDQDYIEEMHPGMNVRVKYILKNMENVITVPVSSIVDDGEARYIYVIDQDENIIKTMEVNVDFENEIQAIISSPDIEEGMVYLNNPEYYEPGLEVEFIDQDMGQEEGI